MLNLFKNTAHRTPKVHLTVHPKEGEAQNITTKISQRLISLTLTDNRGFDADQLDLVLDDTDGLLALPSRNAILTLAFGWKGEPLTYKGEYTVDEIEHSGSPDILTIRARSADLRGSLTNQQARSFHQKTIGEIVSQIASENQLKAKVSEAFEQEIIPHIDQADESPISFLSRLAEQFDGIATVKNGYLLFIEAGMGKSASGQHLTKICITRQTGDSHRFCIAEADNYQAVKAYWHNYANGKRGEVFIDETGISKGKSPQESDSEQIKTLRHTYASEQSALTACKREFNKLQRGTATFSLNLAEGNAELMPELPIEVKGFKKEIDSNGWIITKATHTLSADSGFTTSIECELQPNDHEKEGG